LTHVRIYRIEPLSKSGTVCAGTYIQLVLVTTDLCTMPRRHAIGVQVKLHSREHKWMKVSGQPYNPATFTCPLHKSLMCNLINGQYPWEPLLAISITNGRQPKAEDMNGIQKKEILYNSDMPCDQAPHHNEDILHSSTRWRITFSFHLTTQKVPKTVWVWWNREKFLSMSDNNR
jgi:hypothetical protein